MLLKEYTTLARLKPQSVARDFSESDLPLQKRGVSLAWLIDFLENLQRESQAPRALAIEETRKAADHNRAAKYGMHDQPYMSTPHIPDPTLMNVHSFVEQFVKPLTQEISAPLYARVPDEFVGPPEIFISHSWNALLVGPARQRIGTIDSLKAGFSNPELTFVWIDFICYNQHLFETIAPDMEQVIGDIGRIGFAATPVPLLNRAWCLWELLCSERTGASPEIFVRSGYRNDKILSVNAFFRSFNGVEDSQTTSAQDRDDIFKGFIEQFGTMGAADKYIDTLLREKLSHGFYELQERGSDLQFRPYPWIYDEGSNEVGRAAGVEEWRTFDPWYEPELRQSFLLGSDTRVFDELIRAGLYVPNINCRKARVTYDLDTAPEQVLFAMSDIANGDVVAIKRALHEGLSVNTIFNDVHVLTHAVISGNLEAVGTLMDAGADPDGTGSKFPPLHTAAHRGDLATVRLLIDKGATVNCNAPTGETALVVAARMGHTEVVDYLLQNGADLHLAVGQEKLTALHGAAIGGHLDVITCLLNAGSAVAPRASNGATPLHYALYNEQTEAAQLLMEHSSKADLEELAKLLAKKPT